MGVNFLVQVLVVRHLSKGDYGAFAYALSALALAESFAVFGLDRAVTRFVPIYQERGEYPKVFGTLVMVMGGILGLGVAIVLLTLGLRGSFTDDALAAQLVAIMILLAPVQAYDEALIGLFAVFAKPRSIFFRKHVLAPALRLAVVLLFVVFGGSVFFLTAGYVAAGLIGVVLYSLILWREMAALGLWRRFSWQTLQFPAREVLSFTVPLFTSDLVYVLIGSAGALLLGHFGGAEGVADFKVIQPAARLNQIVLTSFGLLFTPAAARLFARGDRAGINELYWRNAVWIAVMSFPIFVVTFSLARPLTVLLYGERYVGSAPYLAMLSLAFYFNAALGQNGLTLKVFGRVRYVVAVNLLTALLTVGLSLALIPPLGSLGAALATTVALVLFNVLKQAGLRLGTGIRLLDPRYARAYASIAVVALGLLVVQVLTPLPDWVGFALGALGAVTVVRLNRHLLDVATTFPEALRLPFAKWLLGPK